MQDRPKGFDLAKSTCYKFQDFTPAKAEVILQIDMQKKLWSKEFIAIIGSSLFMAWAYFALTPTLPLYLLNTLEISHRNVGLLMATFYITAILVRPVSGYLLDNYHRSAILIISLTLITVGYGIYPLAATVPALFLLRFLHGTMWGVSTSASAPMIADMVPATKIGQGIGIYAVTVPVGMTIGPMFGLALLDARGANVMFVAILGISFLSLVGAVFARMPVRPVARRKFSMGRLFCREALPLSFCMFFIMIAYGAITVFVGIYAAQKHFSNVASFFLCFSIAIFVSRLFAGRLFDRGHISRLVLAGLALAAAGMLWLGFAEDAMQFLVAGGICGLGFGTVMPTCQAGVNSLVKSSETGAANSTYLISYDLGVAVGSFLIGFLSDRVPLAHIYRYTTFLILLSAGIFILKALPYYHLKRRENGGV